MRRLSQSVAYTIMLKLFLSADHSSVATGKTVAITLSKAGGAFANPNAGATNATEVSNGWYKVALDATDTGTIGDLVIRGTSAGCDDSEQIAQIATAPATVADIPTANANADALLDRANGVETGRTMRQVMRIMLAALAGKASGLATSSATYRDSNDTKDRIVATVDINGNRSTVALDPS